MVIKILLLVVFFAGMVAVGNPCRPLHPVP